MAAETTFSVKYDGPELAKGEMAVRDLAPALLALGELFTEASAIIYPEKPPVSLNIRATNKGSFDVHLVLQAAGEMWDQISALATSDAAVALVFLKEVLVDEHGLFWLIKRLKNKTVLKAEPDNSGQVTITVDDQTSFTIPNETLHLYEKVSVRKKANSIVAPVSKPGVDSIEFRDDTTVTVSVGKIDIDAFEVPESPSHELLETDTELFVQIASPVLEGNTLWRVTDGDSTLTAQMDDKSYLQRVANGEIAFRKGDSLRCRVRVVQSQTGDKLTTKRYITQVIEHIPRPTQLELIENQK